MPASINELLRSKGLVLRSGTVVDATLVSAPSSTRNADGERDPKMHRTKKAIAPPQIGALLLFTAE
jgi:IS5 family transposase